MDEETKFFIQIMQHKIKNLLESGIITDPREQQTIIGDILEKLYLLRNQEINEMLKKYYTDQWKILKESEKPQEQINKNTDEYTKNMKDLYEELKKL